MVSNIQPIKLRLRQKYLQRLPYIICLEMPIASFAESVGFSAWICSKIEKVSDK